MWPKISPESLSKTPNGRFVLKSCCLCLYMTLRDLLVRLITPLSVAFWAQKRIWIKLLVPSRYLIHKTNFRTLESRWLCNSHPLYRVSHTLSCSSGATGSRCVGFIFVLVPRLVCYRGSMPRTSARFSYQHRVALVKFRLIHRYPKYYAAKFQKYSFMGWTTEYLAVEVRFKVSVKLCFLAFDATSDMASWFSNKITILPLFSFHTYSDR